MDFKLYNINWPRICATFYKEEVKHYFDRHKDAEEKCV